jgi:hypothetical protein
LKDISSSSSESTNTTKENLTYHSTILPNGQKQYVNANVTVKIRTTRVTMNQKIFYFLEIYAGTQVNQTRP